MKNIIFTVKWTRIMANDKVIEAEHIAKTKSEAMATVIKALETGAANVRIELAYKQQSPTPDPVPAIGSVRVGNYNLLAGPLAHKLARWANRKESK